MKRRNSYQQLQRNLEVYNMFSHTEHVFTTKSNYVLIAYGQTDIDEIYQWECMGYLTELGFVKTGKTMLPRLTVKLTEKFCELMILERL